MTDSEPTPPDAPGAGTPPPSPPPPPPPSGSEPSNAYEALVAAGNFTSFLAAVDAVPFAANLMKGPGPVTVFAPNDVAFKGVTPPADPAELEQLLLSHIVNGNSFDTAAVLALTEVGVATGVAQPVNAAATPPTIGGAAIIGADIPSGNGFSHELDKIMPVGPVPWYKKPVWIALMVLGGLLLLGLLAWWIFGGDDDDDASSTSNLLVLEVSDSVGANLDVGVFVEVTGPADALKSFVWLRPDGTAPGEIAGESTGADGRVDFEWEADDTVADPTAWQSTATGVADVPAGWTPPGPVVDCVLQPFEGQQSVVSMSVELDSPDTSIDRQAFLSFPNYTFTPGDTVTCRLAATAPVETSTTVVETTVVETTVVETTVPDTTVPETTVPETTVPVTTVPVTTVAPAPAPNAYDALVAAGNFTSFLAAVDAVPSVADLVKGPGPVTVFAPNDAAFNGVTPPADAAELEQLLLSHIVNGNSLDAAAVLALTEVEVATGGAQPVNAAVTPPTIGGAGIIGADIPSGNGFSHELDNIMPVAPAP